MTENAHSVFGGSVAYRVLNCHGSTALLGSMPKSPSSDYADEGTLAHDFAAYCLEVGERDANSVVDATLDASVDAKPCTQEMATAIQVYLDAVYAELDRTPDAQIFVEESFTLGDDPDVFGTADCIIYHSSLGRLVCFDYKHGAGVKVDVEDNDQAKFYATGCAFSHDWPLKEVILVIVQPRYWMAEGPDDAVSSWPFDPVDLLEFQASYTAAVETAKAFEQGVDNGSCEQEDLLLTAGLWCNKTFCDARVACPAYQAMQLADTGFENCVIEDVNVDDLPPPSTLTMERLAGIVAAASRITKWANQCQEYLEAMVLGGTPVPGWKVVDKIGRAKWVNDQDEIASQLSLMYGLELDLIQPRKLETITNVLALMKANGATKNEIDSFKLRNTLKESSGHTIAPDTDSREAIDVAARAFGDVKID